MMYEEIVEPTHHYGSKVWVLNDDKRNKVEGVETNCLYRIQSIRRYERGRNMNVHISGNKISTDKRMSQRILRCFDHVGRIKEKLVKKNIHLEVLGVDRRRTTRQNWIDGMKEVVIQEARVYARYEVIGS